MSYYADRQRFDGSSFLVIGAGSGMGGCAARGLSELGASVACVDIRPEAVDLLQKDIGAYPIVGDVTNRGELERIIDEAENEVGNLKGFVDIVGLGVPSTALNLSEELLNQQLTMNLRHAVNATQIVAERIIGRGGSGSFVFVSSIMGARSAPGQVAYGVAKAALDSFIRSASLELGPKGIRLNAVAPGFILTPNVLRQFPDETFRRLAPETPLGRLGTPEDIAGAVLFLLSDSASFITGQTFPVDGGVNTKFGYQF